MRRFLRRLSFLWTIKAWMDKIMMMMSIENAIAIHASEPCSIELPVDCLRAQSADPLNVSTFNTYPSLSNFQLTNRNGNASP